MRGYSKLDIASNEATTAICSRWATSEIVGKSASEPPSGFEAERRFLAFGPKVGHLTHVIQGLYILSKMTFQGAHWCIAFDLWINCVFLIETMSHVVYIYIILLLDS